AALRTEQRRQKPDRPGAGDERDVRLPGSAAPADALDMFPGLGDDARRLEQHAEQAERGVELDGKVVLDAELLGAIAVALFDAALGVEPVAAHVPFADGAGRTRHRIGTAHDSDHEIAARKPAALRRFFDAAERLVAEDQMPGPGRW